MELYLFIVCLSVFILLTLGLSFLVYLLYKSIVLNIQNGSYDEEIIHDENLKLNKNIDKSSIVYKTINKIFTIFVFIFLIFAVVVTINTGDKVNNISLPKVVLSGSMSYKNDDNLYLFENNLDNQIKESDLIFIEKLPDTLNKYDIVLYKNKNNVMVIHRIIDIIFDDDGKISYILKGDANSAKDPLPVYREQMIGIYNGRHIAYLGHFVRFLQSYPGMLCIGLCIFSSIAWPFVNKKLTVYKKYRLTDLEIQKGN